MSGKLKFRCWAPDDAEEADAREIEALEPEDAATWCGELQYVDGYPEQQRINVRAPDGTLTRWTVTAEPTVNFTARVRQA